ncbi:tRNA pseudouridine(38-40) synthase TruA [candidate division FCPU426 bacterium]|nr:tRNA pseudouridine(38-40) synthase TruA [candidate division FCPU426 bacterium]
MTRKIPVPAKRYALTLEYDGAAFAGFQLQKNAHTVQAALEEAIWKRFREKRRVAAASRTDAGVHARGQVAVFDLAYALPLSKLPAALNSALPPAVRVLQAKKVPSRWEPRRSARNKTYVYLLYDRHIASPLWQGRAWQVFHPLDDRSLRQAAKYLKGRHDFSAFRASGCAARHAVRTVQSLSINRQGHLLTLRFTADAFLYHMVRNLVGTLVLVGKGKMTPGQVKNILHAKNRKLAGPTAPACGLYLEKIRFGR